MIDKKVGILGGGQLGKMLQQSAMPFHISTSFLDADAAMSARPYSDNYFPGSFKSYDDVLAFCKDKDVVTIEIEHVNTDALIKLEQEGKEVYPAPAALNIIKDKGIQKQFYIDHKIPTPPGHYFNSKEEIIQAVQDQSLEIPFVQKSRAQGYDGKGVYIVKDKDSLSGIMDTPSVIEPMVDLLHEISVVTVKDQFNTIKHYEPVEMVFDPKANLLDVLACPARISQELKEACIAVAREVCAAYDTVGLLAVELFVDKNLNIWVNEVAPRPHNSGHHTIENAVTSQYENHLRAICGLPLGATEMNSPAVMINILGSEGHQGPSYFDGLEDLLAEKNVHIHWYGKTETRPFRKMGHITILDEDLERCLERAQSLKGRFQVIAK